jgi:hypothetical protein
MEYIEKTETELIPGKAVHLEVNAVFESQSSCSYTFRLANGVRMTLPREQRLNDQIMWQGLPLAE